MGCLALLSKLAWPARRIDTLRSSTSRRGISCSSPLTIREWLFRLARSGIADENLQQVQAPEQTGTPITRSAPARNKRGAEPNRAAPPLDREGDSAGASG